MKMYGGICISGTTNAAVSNAADVVKEKYPDVKLVRNYSVMAENEISEKFTAISLKK